MLERGNGRVELVEERTDAVSIIVKQIEGVMGKPNGAFKRVADPSIWGTISSGHEKVKALEERMDRELGGKPTTDVSGRAENCEESVGRSEQGRNCDGDFAGSTWQREGYHHFVETLPEVKG